jgi:subfamily B ATP-binding cassette protein MsbA
MSAEQSSPSSYQLYKRLLSYTFKYWPIFIYAVIGMIMVAATTTSFTVIMKPIMDDGFVARDPDTIKWIPVLIIAIFLLRVIGTFASSYGMSVIGRNVIRELRAIMFQRLIRLSKSYYDSETAGKIISRFSYDVEQVATAATRAVTVFIKDSLTIVALIGWMVYLNPTLALVFLTVTPVVAILILTASKYFRRHSKKIQSSMGDVSRVVEEAIKGQLIIKIFGGQTYEQGQFEQANETNRSQNLKLQKSQALFSPLVQLLVALALALIIYIATHPAMKDVVTPGDFVSYITAMSLLMPSLRSVTSAIGDLQRGIAAADSVFSFIDMQSEHDTGTYQVDEVEGNIEFEDIWFQYEGTDRPALDDISLQIEAGSTVAFVGRSGSGKTTLLNLIPRLYKLQQGHIRIDGIDIDDYTLENLRSHISYVGQDIVLFNDTIEHNIAYGSLEDCSHDDVVQAAKAAHAYEFIETTSDGFDTEVGERGMKLSGGQRQRIAIARALLSKAPILILDEATSALDNESERYIKESLDSLIQSCTTLVIAHRLSTIENADHIVVMDKGRIVEQGTHAELITEDGYYAMLHTSDFKE